MTVIAWASWTTRRASRAVRRPSNAGWSSQKRRPHGSHTMRRRSHTSVTGRPDASSSRTLLSRRSWTRLLGAPHCGHFGRPTVDATRTASRSGASTTTPVTLICGSHNRTDITSLAIEALRVRRTHEHRSQQGLDPHKRTLRPTSSQKTAKNHFLTVPSAESDSPRPGHVNIQGKQTN